jgi:hypothetical protein
LAAVDAAARLVLTAQLIGWLVRANRKARAGRRPYVIAYAPTNRVVRSSLAAEASSSSCESCTRSTQRPNRV